MLTTYTIEKYSTHITINCPYDGYLDKWVNISSFIDKHLTVYEYYKKYNRYLKTKRFCRYDKENNKILFPRYVFEQLKEFLFNNKITFQVIDKRPDVFEEVYLPFRFDEYPDRDDKQTQIIEFLTSRSNNMLPVDLLMGQGKFLENSAKIKIPGGWTTIGEIKVGDTVTAWDGTPTKVIGVYPQGKKLTYRIQFSDDRYTLCGGEHLWKIIYPKSIMTNNKTVCYSQHSEVISLKELYDSGLMNSRPVYIPLCGSEQIDDVDLPIDPYILGSMLEVNKDKFISEIYLNASHKQRLELIQGILDTNGDIGKFNIDQSDTISNCDIISYSTSSEQLAKDIQYLIRSLGGICKIHEKASYHEQNESVYTLIIEYKYPSELFTLSKKKDKLICNENHNDELNLRIKNITPYVEAECTCIAIDHPDKLYITDDFIVTHNTFCSIKAACILGQRTLVVVSGLIGQWVKEWLKFTKLRKSDIYIIKGNESIRFLLEMKRKPKIIIASTTTISLWLNEKENNFSDLISFKKFIKLMKFGTKILDECHMNFLINTIIDLNCNVENNIYLSATYERSVRSEQKIFTKIFPEEIVFKFDTIQKYTDVYFYSYSLGFMKKLKTRTYKGYSHSKYEGYLINNTEYFNIYFNKVIIPIIEEHYFRVRKDKQKLLILVNTVNLVYRLVDELKIEYPDLVVNSYVYKDPDSNLEDGVDIIVSTPSSAGVGRDIKNLKTCYLTCSLASSPLTKQIFGRLRELKDDTPVFVDDYNRDLDSHRRHKQSRSEIYKQYAKQYTEKNIL